MKIGGKTNAVIELMVVVTIILFLFALFSLRFNEFKKEARDTVRMSDMAVLKKSLFLYFNGNNLYPVSAGECLNKESAAGKKLIADKSLAYLAGDSRWPDKRPFYLSEKGEYAVPPARAFCYYYFSDGRKYYLSYFLENGAGESGGIKVVASP